MDIVSMPRHLFFHKTALSVLLRRELLGQGARTEVIWIRAQFVKVGYSLSTAPLLRSRPQVQRTRMLVWYYTGKALILKEPALIKSPLHLFPALCKLDFGIIHFI